MKNKLSILLFICLNFNLFAQSEWIQVNPGFGHNYQSVHFADSLNGLACGLSGAIAKTTNGGLNWTNISSGTSNKIFDIVFLTNDIAVAMCSNMQILRTTNRGSNWTTVYQGTTQGYTDQAGVFNHGSGLALAYSVEYVSPTLYPMVYTSSDFGATWILTPTTCYGRYFYFINQTTGWANGSYSAGSNFYITCQKTTNGALNWNMLYSFQTVSVNPDFIYFLNENTGFRYLNLASFLYKTTNSGYTWNGVQYTSSIDLNSICFVDNDTGWTVGSQGAIYKSTNAGVNWIQQASPLNVVLNKIFLINPRIGWIAAGSSGILIKNPSLVGVKQVSQSVPAHYSLLQNYPNPFNPSTMISFEIPKTSNVKILIRDVLGREVSTLVNEQLMPGSYEVEWPAKGGGSNYSSGVYFYQLITEQFTETKRMVLIK